MKWRSIFLLSAPWGAVALGAGSYLVACNSSPAEMNMTGNDASVAPVMCAQGLTNCNGACVDTLRDRAHCGECGLACDTKQAEVCKMGQCVFGCSGSTSKCGEDCFDLKSDPGNCGACGNKCPPGFLCSDGKCGVTCMQGLEPCDTDAGTVCTNLAFDDRNCGACGAACTPGSLCDMGMCVLSCQEGLSVCTDVDGGASRCTNLNTDSMNCGGCGKVCTNGTFCSPPMAVDAGDAGPPTCGLFCFGGTTKCGNKCADTQIDKNNCGGCGLTCDGGASCKNGMCQ